MGDVWNKEDLITIIQLGKEYYEDKINNILKGKRISLTEEAHLKDIQKNIMIDFDIICKNISNLKV